VPCVLGGGVEIADKGAVLVVLVCAAVFEEVDGMGVVAAFCFSNSSALCLIESWGVVEEGVLGFVLVGVEALELGVLEAFLSVWLACAFASASLSLNESSDGSFLVFVGVLVVMKSTSK